MLGMAVSSSSPAVAARCAHARADVGTSPLLAAVAGGHGDVLDALLENGARPDGANASGLTPLWLAAQAGDLASVRALLAAGAPPDQPGPQGASPLYEAAKHGHLGVAQALLAAGADLFLGPTTTGGVWTPIMVAEAKGHTAVAALLQKAKA